MIHVWMVRAVVLLLSKLVEQFSDSGNFNSIFSFIQLFLCYFRKGEMEGVKARVIRKMKDFQSYQLASCWCVKFCQVLEASDPLTLLRPTR